MSRNASGTYSLPIGAFAPQGLIKSSDHNSNYSDIATALTQSLATTGVSTMTGQVKAAAGTAAAPAYAFGTDLTTGLYLPAVHQLGLTTNGVQAATFNSDQSATFVGPLTVGTSVIGKSPTYQQLSGAGNYTPTAGTIRSKIRMVGGGAGGQAENGGAFNAGGNTTFGGWTALGATGQAGGFGGSTGTGNLVVRIIGGAGGPAQTVAGGATLTGGVGGTTGPFGGSNTLGSGGYGASSSTNGHTTGAGGGSGEYVEFVVQSPGVIAYSVGTGGTLPVNGQAGNNGTILVEEFYS